MINQKFNLGDLVTFKFKGNLPPGLPKFGVCTVRDYTDVIVMTVSNTDFGIFLENEKTLCDQEEHGIVLHIKTGRKIIVQMDRLKIVSKV